MYFYLDNNLLKQYFCRYMTRSSFRNFIFLLPVILFSACVTTKQTVYFSEDAGNTEATVLLEAPEAPPARVQPDDILSINVTSISSLQLDSDPVAIYKDGGVSQSIAASRASMGGGATASVSGYLVDENGDISFPVLGKVHVAGKTVPELKTSLASQLSSYVKSPVVEVRITNFKVSVVGEVSLPGAVVAANQRLSILDALAAAGDIRIGGRKDNVMVVRQQNGKKEVGYIDLTKRTSFSSPYFYLMQNDIVNVSPSVVRQQEANVFTRVYLPVFTTVVSAALAVYGLIQISRK